MKEQRWDAHERELSRLSEYVMRYLAEGASRPDGKLPLFDENGDPVSRETVEEVVNAGLAEPAYDRQILKDWKILRLTEQGRKVVLSSAA